MYEKAKIAFEDYIDKFDRDDSKISLKYYHTYQVVDLMAELAFRLNLSKEDIELAKVIGLLHDIGRFEQINKFNVISDSKSGMDHALFGVNYLINEHHIKDFGIEENSEIAKIIEVAVKNHNRLEIEDGLTARELLFSKMIRDMDKVDIFRVCATKYEFEFDANDVTKEVLKMFSENKSIDKNNLKTKTDKTIFYLSFIFDINFDESFDILVSTDNFDLYLSIVEVDAGSEKLWKKLREVSFDYINKGVGTNG